MCKSKYLVPASGSAWAFGGSVVPSRCFLWMLGFFCGVGGPLFVGGGVWGLVFDESLGLVVSGVISGEVLGLYIRVAIGRQVASVSRRG